MPLDLSPCNSKKGLGYAFCVYNVKRAHKSEQRTERIAFRQDGRTDRSANRAAANSVAYMNGIDPKASMWQGIAATTGSLANAASAILAPNMFGSVLGGGMHNTNAGGRHDGRTTSYPRNDAERPENEPLNNNNTQKPETQKSSMLPLLLGGFALWMFTKK